MINRKILSNLMCIKCSGVLKLIQKNLFCSSCGARYPIIKNRPIMLATDPKKDSDKPVSDFMINKLKIFFRKFPKIYSIFYYLFGALFVGKSPKKIIRNIGLDKLIVNLGSGPKKLRDDIINVDFYPFINVDVVADIGNLPFKSNSIDVIINEAVLEHNKNPQLLIKEMHRVLKPGGLIYITTVFVASFHSSPNDYYRWSKEGLRELLGGFKEKEIGIICGPTSAMLSIFNEWLAIFCSFGIKYLHQILLIMFTVITSPLKIFDYLISKFPSAQNIAYGFYYIGTKKRI